EVIEKMQSYGDRVQFESPGAKRRGPYYQIINARDMKMGFDDRHLLLRLNADGNIADELSPVFTLDALKAAQLGTARKPASRSSPRGASPARRTGTSREAPATPVDTVEQDKYAYFKSHRDYLPEGITKYSQEISELMRKGIPAEQAFDTVIKAHF